MMSNQIHFCKKLFFLVLLILVFKTQKAQTTLGPGDIAIIGWNYDTQPPQEMAIVTLVNISSGTTIRITDYGWDDNTGTFAASYTNTSEGSIAWTTTASIAAGTVIKFSITSGTTPTVSGLPGTVVITGWTNTSGTSSPFSAGGENWFIFQGSSHLSISNSVFGWYNAFSGTVNGFPQTVGLYMSPGQGTPSNLFSYLPPGLSYGSSAIALNISTASGGYHGDNNVYIGSLACAAKNVILSNICNPSNWLTNETTTYNIDPGGTYFPGVNPIFCVSTCPTPTLNFIAKNNVLCNGGSTGSATMSATGGSPFTYTWSPSGGNAASATGLSAGFYTCVTTNSCGITASQTVQITQPTAVAASTAVTNALCNGSFGSATITLSGGSPPYTYTWSSGPTSSVEPTLLAGTYTVRGTDANGCSITRSITISQPSTLATTTAVTNVLCFGNSTGSATITASGGTSPYTYLWSSAQTTSVISSLNAGVRTVTVTDANNCTRTNTVTITQPATALNTSTAITNVLCNGNSTGAATIAASGGTGSYTYLWSSAQTTSVISGLNAGVRTVTVTDANSCTTTNTITITQPTAINTSTAVTNVLCFGNSNGSATITASGGVGSYTYLWSSAQTTSVISGLNAGVRTVTVTDANSCTRTNTVTITQPGSAINTATSVTNVLCNGNSTGSATITATGGTGSFTYLWSSAQTTSVITGLNAGVRTVTVTDANSCTSTNTITINQPTAINTSTAVTNVLCNGNTTGSATVTATGGVGSYTYLWSSAQTTSVISGLNAGVRTVTVTDANGCTRTNTVTITQPASALNTSTTVNNVLCNGGSNGSATITATGGTAGYTYLWSTAATTSVISGLNTGVRTVTVTDANNCTQINTVNIGQPSPITTSVTSTTAPGCGLTNGAITISAGGGTGSLTYSWSPLGGTSNTATGLGAGSYTCIVTDANTCTTSISQSLSNPNSPSVAITSTNAGCAGQTNGSVVLNVTGGNPSYTYSWSPSVSTTSIASSLGAGVYNATVTDASNCKASQSITITAFPLPTVTITNSNSVICNSGSVTLSGNGASTYSWTGGITNNVAFTPTTTSGYTVTGTDVNGCTNTATTNVTVNPLPTINALTSSSLICTLPVQQSATLTGSGATTYTWNPGGAGTSIVISPSVTTIYTVTGTDANGCQNSSIITQSVSTCTGLEQLGVASSEFGMYPNPTTGILNIVLTTSSIAVTDIVITNALGQVVLSSQLTSTSSQLNTTNLPRGIYVVRVGNVTKKIIKE